MEKNEKAWLLRGRNCLSILLLAALLLSGCGAVPAAQTADSSVSSAAVSSVQSEASVSAAQSSAPVEVPEPEEAHPTEGEELALEWADGYLMEEAMSRQNLLEMLLRTMDEEGFTEEDALYAVEHCEADWNEIAVERAKSWLDHANSYADLVKKLWLRDDFTKEEAIYAAQNCGVEWSEEDVAEFEQGGVDNKESALQFAQQQLDVAYPSRAELLKDLLWSYTEETSEYAVENCGADWNEQAVKAAKNWLKESGESPAEMTRILWLTRQYTKEEAEYGVAHCGADWDAMAVKSAAKTIESFDKYFGETLTREKLIRILKRDGFTEEQAVMAAEQNGL